MQTIKLLLADDHTIVRQGLRSLLSSSSGIRIVGEAQNGREAVDLTKAFRPQVVLMDIAMPLLNGIEATREILAEFPNTRVLILSAYSDDAYIESAVAVGAVGFLVKQTSGQMLVTAIKEVVAGNAFYSPQVLRRLCSGKRKTQSSRSSIAKRPVSLTPRQVEVVRMVAEGQANKKIGKVLKISVKTAEKHRQHVMDKLGIHDTAGLTRYAVAGGLVESSFKSSSV